MDDGFRACAEASVAIEEFRKARASGDPRAIAEARARLLAVKAVLERARSAQRAIAEMRKALARPTLHLRWR